METCGQNLGGDGVPRRARGVGDLYRGAGGWICPLSSCAGGFFDPRSEWGPISPVGYVSYPIYFVDAVGSFFTGH
jgi:hypothetical protein